MIVNCVRPAFAGQLLRFRFSERCLVLDCVVKSATQLRLSIDHVSLSAVTTTARVGDAADCRGVQRESP